MASTFVSLRTFRFFRCFWLNPFPLEIHIFLRYLKIPIFHFLVLFSLKFFELLRGRLALSQDHSPFIVSTDRKGPSASPPFPSSQHTYAIVPQFLYGFHRNWSNLWPSNPLIVSPIPQHSLALPKAIKPLPGRNRQRANIGSIGIRATFPDL